MSNSRHTPHRMPWSLTALLASILGLCYATMTIAADLESVRQFDIGPQRLDAALIAFSKQADVQVIGATETMADTKTEGVSGKLRSRDALTTLLRGTSLSFEGVGQHSVRIVPSRAAALNSERSSVTHLAQADMPAQSNTTPQPPSEDQPTTRVQLDEVTVTIPEVLVVGSRSINADIQRTEDDPQPYVVFDREQLEQSQATTIEEFFKNRLPMNTVQLTKSQSASGNGEIFQSSTINLRGMGTNQTLILVDGRRLPGVARLGEAGQPDITAIPLSAIERIEVLPSTAGGIYGGGATGGVINIITRKDYSGVEAQATYGSTFDSGAAYRRYDLTAGTSLEGGKTQIRLAASHSDSNPLLVGDRDFAARGRARQFATNPSAFLSASTPVVGYTSNIRSQNGSNLMLDAGTPLNSPITSVPVGYAGPLSDGGTALVANAGQYNLNLPNTVTGGARTSLLNNPTEESASLNLRREFGSRVDAFADFWWLRNQGHALSAGGAPTSVMLAADAPNNPFTTSIVASFPATGIVSDVDSRSETLRLLGGVVVRLPGDWSAAGDYNWSRSRLSFSQTNPVVGDPDGAGPGAAVTTDLTNGTLDVLRDLNAFPLDFRPYLLPSPNQITPGADVVSTEATLRLSGPVIHLSGGPLMISGAASRREETSGNYFQEQMRTNASRTIVYGGERSQDVSSVYLEARAPIVSGLNATSFIRALELQASVRYDDYETRAARPDQNFLAPGDPLPALTYNTNKVDATTYTVALSYSPIQDLTMRASYATGFLPPSIGQIVPNDFSLMTPGNVTVIDPKRGGVSASIGPIIRPTGGNPDLVPEDSESWTIGMILTPRFADGLRLSLDYTRIDKVNEIASLLDQQILNLEDLLPGRVTRDPLTPADQARGYTGGVITRIDRTFLNLAQTSIEAWDMQADYELATHSAGTFHFYAIGTYQPSFERQTVPGTPVVDSAGFSAGPLEWRGNAGLGWKRGPWTLDWNMQYFDSYFVYAGNSSAATIASLVLNQGSARMPHQLYHDFAVRYRFGDASGVLGGIFANTDIMLGIQNVLDKDPPILATTSATGGYDVYGDPRLRRYSLSVRKSFGKR